MGVVKINVPTKWNPITKLSISAVILRNVFGYCREVNVTATRAQTKEMGEALAAINAWKWGFLKEESNIIVEACQQ